MMTTQASDLYRVPAPAQLDGQTLSAEQWATMTPDQWAALAASYPGQYWTTDAGGLNADL